MQKKETKEMNDNYKAEQRAKEEEEVFRFLSI